MARRKPSFFERLTGAVPLDSYEDAYHQERRYPEPQRRPVRRQEEDPLISLKVESDPVEEPYIEEAVEEEEIVEEGELAVDIINNPSEILIKTMVAGVKPGDLDIDISRDTVSIRGTREFERSINEENYYQKELFWGAFSRVIELPAEVDVEMARATEKHGLLTIILPKIDKNRRTKLQVKSN